MTPALILPDWSKLMNTLFPEATFIVRDVLGNEYKLLTTLPASREVQLVRALEKVGDLPVADVATELQAASKGTTKDMITKLIGVISKLAKEGEILALLAESVSIAHPKLLGRAVEKANACDEGKELLEGIETPALTDLFDITELIQSLLPFVLRPATKAMAALDMIAPAPPQKI